MPEVTLPVNRLRVEEFDFNCGRAFINGYFCLLGSEGHLQYNNAFKFNLSNMQMKRNLLPAE